MSKQTVFRINDRTSFKNLEEHKEDIPSPGDHEILVKVKAVSLNYRDLAISYGLYPFPVKSDVVPCSDASGEIVSFGKNVSGFEKGDKVLGTFSLDNLYGPQKNWEHGLGGPIDGVLREYVTLPYQSVVKVPKTSPLSWEQLASLVCTGVTAWNVLYGNVNLKPGQVVLLQGTGGVSITGLLIAKAAGAVTIITSSSDEKLEYVKKNYGVDYTVNYKTSPKWGEAVNDLIGENKVDYILENAGSGNIEQSIKCIAYGGQIGVIGFLDVSDQSKMPDAVALTLSKGCVMRGINVGSKQLLEEVVQFASAKNLDVPIKTFGFAKSEILEAYQYMQDAKHIGKICIKLD